GQSLVVVVRNDRGDSAAWRYDGLRHCPCRETGVSKEKNRVCGCMAERGGALQHEGSLLTEMEAMSEPKRLVLRLLGEIEVVRAGEPVMLPASRKTRALLAYLAATGRPHRRSRLCSLLWDIPDDPRGALRSSLSKLRAVVDEPGRRRIVA